MKSYQLERINFILIHPRNFQKKLNQKKKKQLFLGKHENKNF